MISNEENPLKLKEKEEEKENVFLLKQELLQRIECQKNPLPDSLYPLLDDPQFNIKIAEKKEFHDTQYDATIADVQRQAELLSEAEFEMAPYQLFVRNFLSFQTPYRSLLLFHGVGTGKTLSAIGVCEEQRRYMRQTGANKRILIVASPNVQTNFRNQLFNERQLKYVDGMWTISDTIGANILREINPSQMKNIGWTREKIVSQVKILIQQSYVFMGYIEFANYIDEVKKKKSLQKEFSHRLLVIDEIHNIRVADDNENKNVAVALYDLVSQADHMRLLLLSATPMYNSYREIIWLLNLMNRNDRRGIIKVSDVFDKEGQFKVNAKGEEVGRELLVRKATGYVSFVRGENPYTFPFRVYPKQFASPEHLLSHAKSQSMIQMNGKEIAPEEAIQRLDLYVTNIGEIQATAYLTILDQMKNKTKLRFDTMETFGYSLMQLPLEALIIGYPGGIPKKKKTELQGSELTGAQGLARFMIFDDTRTYPNPVKGNFAYKESTLRDYGRLFSPEEIGKYSGKMKEVVDQVQRAEGVILVYSQFIDGGIVPMALALEELGLVRYGQTTAKSLFKNKDEKMPKEKRRVKGSYIMITGDTRLSPQTDLEVKAATAADNVDGSRVKVILISRAGSEGLDFRYIRQVHILDPWYNMNRLEQIIGRAVRHFSHRDLPFEKRNVEIFLHATEPVDGRESADMYLYRVAEYKAVQIGRVSRVLKQTSVDCILNHKQTLFTQENMERQNPGGVRQILSSGKVIDDFRVGDVPYSPLCDYMERCEYTCQPLKKIGEEDLQWGTYDEAFLQRNQDKLVQKIKDAFRQRFFYRKGDMIRVLSVPKVYPLVQIYAALTTLVEDPSEILYDRYGRSGHLVNIGDYYLFQPNELGGPFLSIYDRSVPLAYKPSSLYLVEEEEGEPGQKRQQEEKEEGEGDQKRQQEEKEGEDTTTVKEGEKEGREGDQKISKILQQMQENYDLAKTFFLSTATVPRGDDNWYKHAGVSMRKLRDQFGVPAEDLKRLLVHHMADLLPDEQKRVLLEQQQQKKSHHGEIEDVLRDYVDTWWISTPHFRAVVLSKNQYLILDKKTMRLHVAQPEDILDIDKQITQNKINEPNKTLHTIIGFIGYENNNQYLVFKLRNTDQKRNTGARCDEAVKAKKIQFLNQIFDKNIFVERVLTPEEQQEGLLSTKGLVQAELCSFMELLLRYYQQIQKDGKTWFSSTFGKG